jgi:hypothetical protein
LYEREDALDNPITISYTDHSGVGRTEISARVWSNFDISVDGPRHADGRKQREELNEYFTHENGLGSRRL